MTRICWKTKRKQVLLAGTMVPPALHVSASHVHRILCLFLQSMQGLLCEGCDWPSHHRQARIGIVLIHLLRRPHVVALWCFEDAPHS